jgi:hypothetical protein
MSHPTWIFEGVDGNEVLIITQSSYYLIIDGMQYTVML